EAREPPRQAGWRVFAEEITRKRFMSNAGTDPDFDPYHKWLGISPAEQPPNYYRLLGVPLFEADVQVIEAAADRALTFLRKHQMGSNQKHANRLLNEVARAWKCLANPQTKANYDATLEESLDAQPRITISETSSGPNENNTRRTRNKSFTLIW